MRKNMIASPQFHNRTNFDNNLLTIELQKSEIVFNEPLYVGMTILDISKTLIHNFHYDYMLNIFSLGQIKLFYTYTDSLLCKITCNDVYKEVIKSDISKFATSDNNPNNIYISLVNKKVMGLIKDECKGKIINHFVRL